MQRVSLLVQCVLHNFPLVLDEISFQPWGLKDSILPCPHVDLSHNTEIFLYALACHPHKNVVKIFIYKHSGQSEDLHFLCLKHFKWTDVTAVLGIARSLSTTKNAPTSHLQLMFTLQNIIYALRGVLTLSVVQTFFARFFLLLYVEVVYHLLGVV